MRYPEAHAAKSGSVPFTLRGKKSARTLLASAVAGFVGLVPTFMATPAMAAPSTNGLIVSTASATEGDTMTFTIRCTSGADCVGATYSIAYDFGSPSTADSTDVAALTQAQSSLTFTAGTLVQTIAVKAVNDQVYEGTEKFTLTADDGNGDTASGVGTILDAQQMPSYTLSASPATVTENRDGSTDVTTNITATLSGKSATDTVINMTSGGGTATADTDYTAVTGQLTVPANSLKNTVTFPVTVKSDGTKDAADLETFNVNGTAVSGVTPKTASTTVSIKDAETTPVVTLSQSAATGAEGDTITYTVTANPPSELPITVKWSAGDPTTLPTGDDKATPGSDFTYPTDRTVTIQPGSATGTFDVPLTADNLNENTEAYGVTISDPTNAVLGATVKRDTEITDADQALVPTVTVDPTSVTEGNNGRQARTFTATLKPASGRAVTVNWAAEASGVTASDATAGADFVLKSGKLVFPAGTTSQTFTVDVMGDTLHEGDETFNVTLGQAQGDTSADVSNSPVAVTIKDDDPLPTLSVGDAKVKEGDDGTTPVLIPIKLSSPSSEPITVDINDNTSGAQPGAADYTAVTQQVTIPAGKTSADAVVLVYGDGLYESDEDVSLQAAVTSGTVSGAQSKNVTLTIQNDDKPPALKIDNVTAKEGETAQVTATVTAGSENDVVYNISFAGGSVGGSKAADSSDFTNPGTQSVTIPGGTEAGTVIPIAVVPLLEDKSDEGNETVIVSGTSLSGVGAVTSGAIVIGTGTSNPTPTALTLNVAANVTGGINTPISGKATAGATVELWGAPISAANAALAKLATTTAGANGAFTFTRTLSQGYRFAVRSGDETTAEKRVTVTQAPVFVASSTAKGVVSFAVQGTPRGAGQSVIVQRWVGGKWVNAWKGTTGANNQWRATAKLASGTAVAVRAFVAGYTPNGLAGGYSDVKRFTVK
ncbi:beta strand repeat-containing protein [Actinoplanes sp. CA-030573]|uniref:beta strand repeat-containing protein n=1 Tax=Actinoplanes sp. CA-030573 TaxID=3239898 RepID=UPI003D8A5F5E